MFLHKQIEDILPGAPGRFAVSLGRSREWSRASNDSISAFDACAAGHLRSRDSPVPESEQGIAWCAQDIFEGPGARGAHRY